jgi:ribosomal protein S18 acetylase RimI-like enzyme
MPRNLARAVLVVLFVFCAGPAVSQAGKCPDLLGQTIDHAISIGQGVRVVESPEELPDIINLAARTFENDPLFTWIAPEAERRREFLAGMVWHVFLRGKILVDSDVPGYPHSFALWIRSKDASAGPVDMMRNGQLRYAATAVFKEPRKLGQLLMLDSYLLKTRRRLAGDDAVYLYLIGVDPTYQRQGYGARLIEPVLAAARERRTPVVLEIQKPDNEPYYARYGFRVEQRRAVPANAPETSTMVWLPQ